MNRSSRYASNLGQTGASRASHVTSSSARRSAQPEGHVTSSERWFAPWARCSDRGPLFSSWHAIFSGTRQDVSQPPSDVDFISGQHCREKGTLLPQSLSLSSSCVLFNSSLASGALLRVSHFLSSVFFCLFFFYFLSSLPYLFFLCLSCPRSLIFVLKVLPWLPYSVSLPIVSFNMLDHLRLLCTPFFLFLPLLFLFLFPFFRLFELLSIFFLR